MPVSPKKVAGNCGTVLLTSANSLLASCPGTAGNTGNVRPSAIRLLHSLPCRMTNAVPQAMVASNQPRTAFELPNTEARPASTMVPELVNTNQVIKVEV